MTVARQTRSQEPKGASWQLQPETGRGQELAVSGRTIAVFGSGSAPAGHPVLAQAEQLGRMLAEAGFALICGGYGGTMEAASRGARQAGGKVIGVTLDLFARRQQPNGWLTVEERVSDFFPRLQRLSSADGFVVLRGGVGTLTEATLVWTLLQTGQIAPRPFLFIGEDWRRLLNALHTETFVTQRDLALLKVVGSVEEAVTLLNLAMAPTP